MLHQMTAGGLFFFCPKKELESLSRLLSIYAFLLLPFSFWQLSLTFIKLLEKDWLYTHKTCYLQTSIQISSTFYQCLRTIGQKGKFYTIILTRLKSILDGRFENFRRKNFRHSCRSHHTFRQRVTDSVRLQYSLIGNPKLGGFPRTSPIVREDSMLALALAFARHCVGHAVPGQARLF